MWVGDLFKQMFSGFYFMPRLCDADEKQSIQLDSLKLGQTVSLSEYSEENGQKGETRLETPIKYSISPYLGWN